MKMKLKNVFLVLTFFFAPALSWSEQMIIFDKIVEHSGQNRLYEDWDFVTKMFFARGVPLNWLEPVNYAEGRYHIRVEVMSMGEIDVPFKISCGWTNRARVYDPTGQHCTISVKGIKKPGIYGESNWLRSWWHGPADDKDPVLLWDFEHAYLPHSFFTIVAPDPLYPVQNFNPFPLKMRLTLWIVSKGNWWQPDDETSATGGKDSVPSQMTLKQNYPNPFNPDTTIEFLVHATTPVNLSIFNSTGQKVRTLVSEKVSAGTHRIVWNGQSDSGLTISSGIYFVHLKAGTTTLSRRMLLMR